MKGLLRLAALLAMLAAAPMAQAQTSAPKTAKAVVDRAAEAMGGRARVLAVRSLVMEGEGENPNLLQQMSPEAPLLVWVLPQWRRAIDLEHGRTALQMVRRPAFPAVFDNWRMEARLDGDVAFDVGAPFGGPAPPPRRAGAGEVAARRVAMLHHPLAVLRAAMDPRAKLSAPRLSGTETLVDLTTAEGDRLTVGFDRVNGLPVSVRSMSEHPMLGDVATVTHFSGWEWVEPQGVRLPRHLTSTVDGWPEYDIGVVSNALDADVAGLAAPAEVRTATPPAPTAPKLTATPAGQGVWMISGPDGYASVAIEFADHLALIDAPQNEARAEATFVAARALVPGKPLTQLIVSHFHADHAGGVRTAIAEGLTLVTQRGNTAFLQDIARRRFTIQPDALARHPRPLKLVAFDDELTLKDAAMEVRLLHARDSTHGDTLLMAWFPKERLLAQADLWLPGSRITPHAISFERELDRRGLAPAKHLPLHGGQIRSQADFEAVLQGLKAGTMK